MTPSTERVISSADLIVRDVAELPDRTSPEDRPEMMLVSVDELRGIVEAHAEASITQQLVARIKRGSKYYGQTNPGAWFDVRVVADTHYQLRGNNNNYRLSDVVLGVRLSNGAVVNLDNGKTESPT